MPAADTDAVGIPDPIAEDPDEAEPPAIPAAGTPPLAIILRIGQLWAMVVLQGDPETHYSLHASPSCMASRENVWLELRASPPIYSK
jgi:hypothetical protein